MFLIGFGLLFGRRGIILRWASLGSVGLRIIGFGWFGLRFSVRRCIFGVAFGLGSLIVGCVLLYFELTTYGEFPYWNVRL